MSLSIDAPTPVDDVAQMTASERQIRVYGLLEQAYYILADAINTHAGNRTVVAKCILFSGGNDSTVLAHIFRNLATHAIHANTGIGIEATRQFVRDTCAWWDLPLVEEHGESYRELVLERGFPGPAMHWKMYQRLKERALDKTRHTIGVANKRKVCAVFIAGRRREESERRDGIVLHERDGSVIWASPLANWTKLDLNTYRLMAQAKHDPVPVNEVTQLIHMSGECLCGSFAHRGELDEIRMWFPDVAAEIEDLEAEVLATGRHPAYRCQWGWGAEKASVEQMLKAGFTDQEVAEHLTHSRVGPLCQSCSARQGVEA